MADLDFFLGEHSVISEIWSSLQISKLIRSQISYAIHDFVTVDQEIIASDIGAGAVQTSKRYYEVVIRL